jgi:hypothetical protein
MAEKFKSVLEKYDAKGNRMLPTVEEDAIEPDTTLESLLIGPAKAGASAIKNAINKKVQSQKFDTPRIPSNFIGSNVPPSGLDPWKNVGFNKSPREILAEREARSNKGLMLKAAERAAEKGLRRSYGELGSYIADRINAPEEKEQEGISGGFTFPETPSNFKKGGKVSASSRGDGIAKRGKTKGRMC